MSESNNDELAAKPVAPEVVTTRVNVAFPFSNIRLEQPSSELTTLAGLVREVAEVLADLAPSAKTADLAQRAQDLAARLK